jgi:hypothetical protein
MFENKRKPEVVATKKAVTRGEVNAFLNNAKAQSNVTRSGNGAKKFSSSGDSLTDQFTKAGKYKVPRKYSEIAQDCEMLWGEDPLKATKFALFMRTIPRTVNLPDGTKTESPQKGTELKHEAIMRMIWLHDKSPQAFWNNILLFVSLGSWHDVFTMLQYDLSYNGWNNRKLDWDKFGQLILAGLHNKNTCDLVKKYLPQIKARSQATTIDAQSNNAIAKWICSLIFGQKETPSTYKQYRKLKNSGTAHDWQKLISKAKFNELEFDKIHGRALSILVKSKFLKNHGLSDKYSAWITAPTTKDVKYTGYVHELFEGSWIADKNKEATINKQFDTLVQKARDNEVTDLIVVRDTSGSMGSQCPGTKSTCYNVAKAIALYFSEFLEGTFAGHWIEFNSDAKLQKWVGQTPVDKYKNDRSSYVGGTNFQSVINLFAKMKQQGTPESDFPSGILCISDSEFNPASLGQTNVDAAKATLSRAGFSKAYVDNFVIVLWNLQNSYYGKGSGEKFETGKDTQNVFYFGGYSASVVSFLSEKIKTTYDLMDAALNQEVLNMVEI